MSAPLHDVARVPGGESRGYEEAGDWRGLASARTREAIAAREAGDLGQAERFLRDALSLHLMLNDGYDAGRTLTALAEVRLAQGDSVQAAELARQAVERMPGDTEALIVLGRAEWAAGSPADAEVTFSQALHWDADAPGALAGRGQVRAELGSFPDARDDLDRALSLSLSLDDEADARSARAVVLAAMGQVAEARAELARSQEIAPQRPRTRERAERVAALEAAADARLPGVRPRILPSRK
jgi:tetratricopeptide (TPR) repeat protein